MCERGGGLPRIPSASKQLDYTLEKSVISWYLLCLDFQEKLFTQLIFPLMDSRAVVNLTVLCFLTNSITPTTNLF